MRKVFLEQNLGKKSKCRFPKRNQKQVVIKSMIESQKAVSTPSLTQPLVISGVNVLEFCDRFNQETKNYETGLLIRSRVVVNQVSKTFDLDLISPTVFQLMSRVLQTNKVSLREAILLQLLHNIALIKLVNQLGNNYLLTNLLKVIKQTAGNFRSYDFRLARSNKNF